MKHCLPVPTKTHTLTVIGVLFALVFLVYGRTIDYPFVRWDDGLLIYDNPAIRAISFKTLGMLFSTYDPELYIPLTLLSYQYDFLIGGIDPSIYHLQNILWHAMNAALVTWLLSWLLLLHGTADDRRQLQQIALALGALFAVHPMNVEAVAWASARKDLLSTFFALGSILAYLEWNTVERKRWYYASLVLFAFGLLCKVTILTLPLMLLMLDLWSKRHIHTHLLLEKIPFFALSMVFALVAIFGKAGQIASVSPMETILVAGKAIVFTLQKWFVPIGLSVLYPFNDVIALSDPRFILPLLSLLGLFGLLGLLALQKRTHAPLLCFLFFLFALAPSLLNFAKGGTYYITSDRYAYLPSVGILIGLGVGVLHFLRRDALQVRLYRKRWVFGVALFVLLISITLSIRQTKTWASSEALFTNVLEHYPASHVAHNNLAHSFLERAKAEDNLAKAIAEYGQALMIAEDLPGPSGSTDPVRSKILSNLASALRQKGDVLVAISRYEESLRADPSNPYAYLGLGIVAATEGRMGEAESQYQIVLRISPKFTPAYLNLGALYSATGRLEEALVAFDRGIAIDPFTPQAHYNRAVVLQKMNRMTEARAAYAKAIDLAPSFVAARINLGILEANRGHRKEAIAEFQEVLRYDPGNVRATEALRQLR